MRFSSNLPEHALPRPGDPRPADQRLHACSNPLLDLDDGRAYTGGARITVDAPLGKLPVFLAESQILPLLDPAIDTLAPATDPSVVTPATVADRLDAQVALAPGGRASLTLVDGTTLEAEQFAGDGGNPQGLLRVRVTSAVSASSELRIGTLRLTKKGGPPRRIRWDVTLHGAASGSGCGSPEGCTSVTSLLPSNAGSSLPPG